MRENNFFMARQNVQKEKRQKVKNNFDFDEGEEEFIEFH